MTLILGTKTGMTQVFTDEGKALGVTVISAGPCTVCQIRTEERDGYNAIQLGFEDRPAKNTRKPQRGHFEQVGTAPKRYLREERLAKPTEQSVGDLVTTSAFEVGQIVDVIGTMKGRGFAGTIKRHGFHRGPMTHGSKNKRAPGSIGQSAYPGRVFKGMKSSGHYGVTRKTVKNLEIVRIDEARNLILVKGSIPGPNGGLVQIQSAKTGSKKG
ncbi:MAG: large subunit ribosomal protein L3 [Planctomycetota bacterium]|jgi:large subunit ribosomal protein L3